MNDNLESKLKDDKAKNIRNVLKKTVSFLSAATMALCISAGIHCKSSDSSPPPPTTKVTQTGRITDIFSNQPLAGMTITGADSQTTTNSDGNYSFTYTKGTAPVLTMSKAGYVTRTTFPAHGSDYKNIPDGFNMTEFNNICRNRGKTVRWSTDPAKKPTAYITSVDGSAVPSQLKTIINTVVNKYLPQITNNTLTGLSIVEELNYSSVPTSNVFVFTYAKNNTGASQNEKHDGNVFYYSEVVLGGKNGDGSAHTFTIDEVLHEAGHGIGFTGHASTQNSIMWQSGGKPSAPTALDIQNSTVLYDRPAGNSSPDNDPSAVASAAMLGITSFEQSVDKEGPDLFDPFGTRRFVKPREWMLYENEIQRSRMINEKQLTDYEQGRARAIKERK